MKITALFLLAICLHASAHSYSQKVTLKAKNMPLTQVFAELEAQSGFFFVYSNNMLKGIRNVDVQIENMPLALALDSLFRPLALTCRFEDNLIIIKSREASTVTDKKNDIPLFTLVTGTVKDGEGKAVAGISILIKGTATGTVSDGSGHFAVNVKPGDVLVMSGVGYVTKEIIMTNQTALAVILEVKINEMTGVDVMVNNGYQSISKERSAGSFARPDMDIVKARSGSMNILQRLDGLVPGLTVNNAPNVPQGGTATSPILVRGLTTIGLSDAAQGTYNGTGTNRNPLYVVDGIAVDDISFVNPQDVAEITVLKDATAASIWGSRASNGVIVIATKKGSFNDKARITYDGFVNFQGKPDLGYTPALNSKQFIQAAREVFTADYNALYPWATVSAYTNTGNSGVAPHEVILYNQLRGLISPAQATTSLDSLSAIENSGQIADLWYRNASLVNHTLSMAGGTKIHSYYGSASYTNTITNRPGDANKAYKINLRQDFTINKFIQAFVITDLNNTTTSSKRNINIDNSFYPYQLFQDGAGKNLAMPYMTILSDSTRQAFQDRSRINLNYIPLDEFNYGYTKSDALLGRITSGITVKILKGLKFEGVYGFTKGSNRTRIYEDNKSYAVRSELAQFTVAATPAATPVYYLPTTGGTYTVSTVNQRNWNVRNQLLYDNSWNSRQHQLTLLAGQEALQNVLTNNRTTVRGFNELLQTIGTIDYAALSGTGVANPVMPNSTLAKSLLPNSLSTNVFSENETDVRFTSYYANGAYTYNRKYSLNASWRIDQSNLYGKDKSAQNRPVWSTGVKWLISGEDFMSDHISWLDQLALRVTYGITGVSPAPAVASSYNIMGPTVSSFLQGGTGLNISSPANRSLTWESTKTVNIGFDFAVLANRLSGSVDFYRKKTTDLLGNFDVNGFSGYSSVTGNMGDMQNKGVELSLTSRNITARNFSWSTSFVMAYNENLITRLNNPTPISTGALKVAQSYLAGYSAFALFAYKYAGLDNMGDPQISLEDKTVSKTRNISKPGDIAFMGTYQPVWAGGLSNVFRYRSFSLAANAVYNLGHVMRRDVNKYYTGRITHGGNVANISSAYSGNISSQFMDRWQNPGDEANTDVPSYVASTSLSTSRRDITYYTMGDVNVVSASYIKLRDITLSYSLPSFVASRLKAQSIGFRVQASNIMVWKANKFGIDPEFQNAITGSRSVPVNQHTVTVGANIVF